MQRLVYDCEIIKCIPDKYSPNNPNYEYCEGWGDFENMGISVIACCDIDSEKLYYFSDFYNDNPDHNYIGKIYKFPDVFVDFDSDSFDIPEYWGFNSRNFDDRLCQSNSINIKTDYDFLEMVRLSAYGSSDWHEQPPGFSYKLSALAEANGLAKTGTGELAPQMWQQGRYKEVIDYCLNDVLITAKLIKKFGQLKLIDPNTGKVLLPDNPF